MKQITLINRFEVPAGREDEFLGLWQQVNDYMRTKRGYIGHNLYRSLAPDASPRFVNVAHWESVEQFRAAHDEGFRALVNQPGWAAFRYFPSLFELIHTGSAETASIAA